MLTRSNNLRMSIAMVAVLMLGIVGARADVFNMPDGQTSLQTVPVGDPGNVGDTMVELQRPSTGYGAVGYKYDIGKYEVTNAQYCQFLNAKLPTISDDPESATGGVLPSDTYGLYDTNMAINTFLKSGGSVSEGVTYDANGPTGGKFSVVPAYANNPVVFVCGWDTLRFCNWLQNGQGSGNTESGTYLITGGGENSGILPADPRSGEAPAAGHWVLPTENEWYKAAYYKGGGTNSGYWLYATQSNTTPSFFPPGQEPDPTNAANYSGLIAGQPKANNALIPVGSYPQSLSAYGTLDQDGNAYEWTDATFSPYPCPLAPGSGPQARGGDFELDYSMMESNMSRGHPMGEDTNFFGFRVAYVPEVPEPGSFAMLVAVAVASLLYARKTFSHLPPEELR